MKGDRVQEAEKTFEVLAKSVNLADPAFTGSEEIWPSDTLGKWSNLRLWLKIDRSEGTYMPLYRWSVNLADTAVTGKKIAFSPVRRKFQDSG